MIARFKRIGWIFAIATLLTAFILVTSRADAQTPVSTWCVSKANVAIVGTSAETGYAKTGYASTTDTYYPTTYGWTTRFSNAVHAQWNTTTHNYAHNGALASDFLPGGRWANTTGAVADMQTYSPDLVLLDVGGNEYQIQQDPALFQNNLTTLVNNIKAARPGVTILMNIYAEFKWVPNQYTNPPNKAQVYTWNTYASIIYNTAVAQGEPLVDERQYIPPAASSPGPNPSPWASDLIHLNDTGDLVAKGLWWGWVSALGSLC